MHLFRKLLATFVLVGSGLVGFPWFVIVGIGGAFSARDNLWLGLLQLASIAVPAFGIGIGLKELFSADPLPGQRRLSFGLLFVYAVLILALGGILAMQFFNTNYNVYPLN